MELCFVHLSNNNSYKMYSFYLFSFIFYNFRKTFKENNLKITHCTYRCLKIREFRIQSVVGKDPVELEKYLENKIRTS
jgi:hypothetical protein